MRSSNPADVLFDVWDVTASLKALISEDVLILGCCEGACIIASLHLCCFLTYVDLVKENRLAMRATLFSMARSVWKGPFADALQEMPNNLVRGTRRSMILPDWVGKSIQVHNGRKWIDVSIVEDMIGHRLGEFSPTRQKSTHKAVLLKQRQAQKAKKKK